MDRNYIVELIKDNRLQEALKAIEKASEGTHLHNQAIMLSSSYAEYAKMNRSATQDFQTLEMQRAKITNSLLSFLDELSPEDFDKAAVKTTHTYKAPQPTPTVGINKNYLYIGGAVLLLLIIYFASSGPSEDVPVQSPNVVEMTQAQASNPAAQSNTNAVTGETVEYVAYENGHFVYDGTSWVEESNAGRKFRFKEISHEPCCVFLRDESRKMDIELDLPLGKIKWTDTKNGTSGGYDITEMR